MKIFDQATLQLRQTRVTQILKSSLKKSEALIIFSGLPLQKPGGLDQTYDFIPHPLYFWLSGSRRHGGAMFYSLDHGWVHYYNPISLSEKIWEGANDVLIGEERSKLDTQLITNQFSKIFTLGQIENSFSVTTRAANDENFDLQILIDAERRIKDPAEIDLVSRAAEIAKFGYHIFKKHLKPGASERQLQIEYEAEIFRHGSHKLPYGTLIGSGKNSAILHAVPSEKVIAKDELVLIDAGVDLFDYCVDITRVYPASGQFSSQAAFLHALVQKSHDHAVTAAVAGTEWSQIHLLTAKIIAEGLVSMGILTCTTEEALSSEAIGLFYPHGVGHLVGLRVRDTGTLENRNPRKYAGAMLRVDFKIRENYLLTIEPGCYFIPALLNDAGNRKKFESMVNWSEAEKWIPIGGVRIENDVLIQKQGPPKVLTIGVG